MMVTHNWILLFVSSTLIYDCYGLRCWKCISENCHHLHSNTEAMAVVCKEGQSCLKVIYQLGSLFPRYRSEVRSCSAGICNAHNAEDFYNCSSNPRKYNITGCFLRTCCNDKDLCNGAVAVRLDVIFISIICIIIIISSSLTSI